MEQMGYSNFKQNLLRLRKFKEDHINNVISDYLGNPEDMVENVTALPQQSPNLQASQPSNRVEVEYV
jgi:hypothetical protein